jgi:hypothetical protein
MTVQMFTRSMADAGEFAAFGVCERAEGLSNGMGHIVGS